MCLSIFNVMNRVLSNCLIFEEVQSAPQVQRGQNGEHIISAQMLYAYWKGLMEMFRTFFTVGNRTAIHCQFDRKVSSNVNPDDRIRC